MAEDLSLDEPTDPVDIETPEGDDETAKLFAKFWVDPENATEDDLIRVIQRAEKAEKLIIEKKKAEKANPKVAPTKDTSIDLETRLFFVENETARPFKDEFLKVKEQYPELSFDDALELAKIRKPKESKTVKEWFQWGGYNPKPKTLEQLSETEALDLPPEQYAQYLKKTGKIM